MLNVLLQPFGCLQSVVYGIPSTQCLSVRMCASHSVLSVCVWMRVFHWVINIYPYECVCVCSTQYSGSVCKNVRGPLSIQGVCVWMCVFHSVLSVSLLECGCPTQYSVSECKNVCLSLSNHCMNVCIPFSIQYPLYECMCSTQYSVSVCKNVCVPLSTYGVSVCMWMFRLVFNISL